MLSTTPRVRQLACHDANSDSGHVRIADGKWMTGKGSDEVVSEIGGEGIRV